MWSGPAEAFFKAAGVGARKHGGDYRLGGEAVTAHPRYDPDTGELCFCSAVLSYGHPLEPIKQQSRQLMHSTL